MKRVGFVMKLKAGFAEEYKRRHDEIWPELVAELRSAGVIEYTIFLPEPTLMLVAVQTRREGDTTAALASKAVMQRWWKHMADIMDTNEDSSPVVSPLTEMFHMT